jgi:hypothetical protein
MILLQQERWPLDLSIPVREPVGGSGLEVLVVILKSRGESVDLFDFAFFRPLALGSDKLINKVWKYSAGRKVVGHCNLSQPIPVVCHEPCQGPVVEVFRVCGRHHLGIIEAPKEGGVGEVHATGSDALSVGGGCGEKFC